ncbi:microtubule-associated tumor suppressor 1 homolog [Rhincodon typus]|uniref:microtubule-associated tumor suppressor 1 homolog n=1 Tax=Rhincodon typus TaxID=259920 RepID=UPI00202FA1B5|nr:microtubule-associated tumor suppressor 1 homolog [Rhincodon typus]XP_048456522.1 microtubule-associated tumor suppressor 1 homolog [Rhincodon typus]XP_048456523.1 microtubule-associated tumor suppressor 1 homolog [Rhincodon typus]XP_048456524.1 microtubule-associated tumor suppressor 1 homolog [Rhincodon typus]XP_048456525.1 microtubule-associated tumor suppressor 1 homolog [Rhincodon typus]
MSFQGNNSSKVECSKNERRNHFHLPVLISDPNGNQVACSTGISSEARTPLTNGSCECPDMQINPVNIGVDVRIIVSDETACRPQGVHRPELQLADDSLCDRAAPISMVFTSSQSRCSDHHRWLTDNCCHAKCSVTSDPGERKMEHEQNRVDARQMTLDQTMSECHVTDCERKFNSYVTNEAHHKTLKHRVSDDCFKLCQSVNPNDTVVKTAMNKEINLEHSVPSSESKLEMKHNVDDMEYESSVPVAESSVFSNSSGYSFVMSDQSLETFENPGETETLNVTRTIHQLSGEANLNFKQCVPLQKSQLHVLDKVEETHSFDQGTGPAQCPTLNLRHTFGDQLGGPSYNNSDKDVKCEPNETADRPLPVVNEHCNERTPVAEMGESKVYEMLKSSAMNTTFIVLKDVSDDSKFESEIDGWVTDAKELVPQPETCVEGNVSDQTFLVSSPAFHEHDNSASNTSTPLPESRKIVFFGVPFQNPADLSDNENCCTPPVEESPTNLILQPGARDSVQKPGFRTKCNTNMKSKLSKVEIKSYPKPNFNNVKPKVVSRAQQISSVSKSRMCPVAGVSSYFPRCSSSISSIESPCSLSPAPKQRKEQLSQSALKLKSDNAQVQKMVFRKRIYASEQQTFAKAEKRNFKSSRSISCQARVPLMSTTVDGAESQVFGSLHVAKAWPPSVGANACELEAHHCGVEDINLSKHVIPGVKPRPRCRSLAGETDDLLLLSSNCPAAAACEVHTIQAPLTKSSAPSVARVQVGQKPSLGGTTKSQTLPSPSAKLRTLSSTSKLQQGRVNHDGRAGNMCSSKSKQPLISDQQKANSIKAKPRSASLKPALNWGGNVIKSTPGSKLPVPASRLQRINSLSSVSSGVSIQSVQSTCSNKSAVASTNHQTDGPRKRALSANSSSIQTPCAKSLQKNKVVSVKTPCKGLNKNVTTSNQSLQGSGSKSSRQLSTSRKFQADKTWVKSNSSTQKPSSQTTRVSTQTPSDLLPVVKKSFGLPHYKAKCEKQVEWIALLKELLKASNQRFEAVAVVVQYLHAQREEVGKQRKELSQELLSLRSELETRNVTCVQLEKDREELQNRYEGVIQKLSEEHQNELKELEKRLEALFTAEKEHLQQNFENDVKKLQAQLQKEVESLTCKHDAHKLELIATHSKNLECLHEEYQQSLTELTRSHELEQKTLEKSFKERQSLLQGQIAKLNEENDSLKKEIKNKEEITKAQAQKEKKIDPLSLYLQQELDSLKAVLEIKNEKIHNQEKKLMQMEKLVEKHTVLDEKLKIVMQENEDLKARMDKHIAVSRQLSTEQVVLQESLQKESKVNKRLSMENEELLWKLHNGDVLGPKKLSPTSPLSFQPSKTPESSSSNPALSPR